VIISGLFLSGCSCLFQSSSFSGFSSQRTRCNKVYDLESFILQCPMPHPRCPRCTTLGHRSCSTHCFFCVFWSAINVNSAIDPSDDSFFLTPCGVLVISINVTGCRHFTNNTKLQSLLVALPTPCGAIFEGVPLPEHAEFFSSGQ
jgi:hypothetical protein